MKDNRERFKCECPCGNVFWATKSFMHQMGMLENGCGSCPECKIFYNLTLDEENKRMILTPWNDWVEARKEKEKSEQ